MADNENQNSTSVTDADFATRVLRAPGIVLVDVWAPWCAPCVTLAPVLERLATEYADSVQLLMLDADSNPVTVEQYQVRSLPTVLVFRDGVLTARQTGALPYGAWVSLVDQVKGGSQLIAGNNGVRPDEEKDAPDEADTPAHREALALAASRDAMLIFKHSATCEISAAAKLEYDEFMATHPELATRLVVVQKERALSDALADVLEIRHESPQAILVRNGEARWHASHGQITVATLERSLTS